MGRTGNYMYIMSSQGSHITIIHVHDIVCLDVADTSHCMHNELHVSDIVVNIFLSWCSGYLGFQGGGAK